MKVKKTSNNSRKKSDQIFRNSVRSLRPSPKKIASSTHTTTKQQMNTKLFDIVQTEQYKKTAKVSTKKDQLKLINDKLEIKEKSKEQYQIRLKANDLYLKYQKNPLLPFTPPSKSKQIGGFITPVNKVKQNQMTIFEGIRRLSLRSNYNNIMTRLKQYKVPGQQEQLLRKMDKRQPKIPRFQSSLLIEQQPVVELQNQENNIESQFDFLDVLVKRKDENDMFEKLKKKNLNIFHFLKHPQSPEYYSNQQHLGRHYFCRQSIVKSMLNIGDYSLHRDISYVGRYFMKGKYAKLVDSRERLGSDDLMINIQKITFEQLMMVSSGRLQSSVLQSYFNKEHLNKSKQLKYLNQKQANIQVLPFKYKQQNARPNYFGSNNNKSTLYSIQNYSLYEGTFSKDLPINKAEEVGLLTAQQDQQTLQELSQLKQLLTKYHITNKNTLKALNNRIDNLLKQQINKTPNHRNKNAEEKIRVSKRYKDRIENIIVQGLTRNIREKKRYDQRIKQFTFNKKRLRHQSKEISPTKENKKSPSPHSKSVGI